MTPSAEDLKSPWHLRNWVYKYYEADEIEGLIEILKQTQGKTVDKTLSSGGKMSNNEDLCEVLLFNDGTGLMLDFSGSTPAYSSWTPGSDSEVQYYRLTRRNEELEKLIREEYGPRID